MTAYAAMKAQADHLKWPESYKTDLTEHDRAFTQSKFCPPQFGWSIRVTGTDVYRPSQGGIDHLKSAVKCGPKNQAFYFWNGTALESMTPQALTARLETIYRSRFFTLNDKVSIAPDEIERIRQPRNSQWLELDTDRGVLYVAADKQPAFMAWMKDEKIRTGDEIRAEMKAWAAKEDAKREKERAARYAARYAA